MCIHDARALGETGAEACASWLRQNEGFVRMGLNELYDMRGIGASLTVGENGDWSVAHVLQNGAASDSTSRLMPGEVISHVDEWEITGASSQQVRKLLEGPHGSKVVLSVKSSSGGQPRQVEIVRGKKPRSKQPSLTNARDDQPAPSPRARDASDVSPSTSYDSESYAHSSGLHQYEEAEDVRQQTARGNPDSDVSPYRPGKPREMVTSLDVDGAMAEAAAKYKEKRGDGGGAGPGGGVFEEPLLRLSVQSDRFGPVASAATMQSDKYGPATPTASFRSSAQSDRYGPVSERGSFVSQVSRILY